jgi:hypothetical protein
MEKKTTRPGLGHRKARLRRNADGGPNLLLWGGLAVGGYIAYRWLMGSKSDKASVSIAPVVGAKAPAIPADSKASALPSATAKTATPSSAAGVPTQAQAWAATLAASGGRPPDLNEQQFASMWATLTDEETRTYLACVTAMGGPNSEATVPEVMKRPAFETLMGKLQAVQSASAPKGTSGIGNYYNEG